MTEQEFYKQLGQKCKELREKAGIQPKDMIKLTGISRSLLYEFENKGKKISAFRLNKIMEALKIPSILHSYVHDSTHYKQKVEKFIRR